MILYFSPLVRSRTSLIAASLASVPELQKKAWPPNDRSERSLAHSPCGSVYQVLGTWISRATCSWTARTTGSGQWPSRLQPQPGNRSRYSRPSASQTREFSPFTRQTGNRR